MILTLRGSDRLRYTDYFEQFFRLRHQIFVAGRGWPLPSINGLEIDEYDVDDAVYFFDLDEQDRIEGAVRITPTESWSLTADYFPHLVENGAALRAPDVYEATRYIVMPTIRSSARNRAVRARILSALTEWCLDRRISFIQAVIDSTTFATFVELNPLTRPMGLTHPYGGGRGAPGGGECLAIRWPCTRQVLDQLILENGLETVGGHLLSMAENGKRVPLPQ